MSESVPQRPPVPGRPFPRVPAHAWAWLQRSRPVLSEAAQRLTGGPPSREFLEGLQESFATDPFVRDVLIGVIADVAFKGRVPSRRPPGVSWDRGLIWWAAAIAGVPTAEFDGRAAELPQRRLFDPERAPTGDGLHPSPAPRAPRPTSEGAHLAAALRQLLESCDGDSVPVSAVRQLIAQLEGGTAQR